MTGNNQIRRLILVPGGGLQPDGEVPLWVRERLDQAIQLYNATDDSIIVALSAGTTHKPLVCTAGGFPVFESVAAAQYLQGKNIPATRIYTETSSYDTIGNAFFSRVVFAEPYHIVQLHVITSEFHIKRTRLIFDWVYGLTPNHEYQISYTATANTGVEPAVLEDRIKKEEQAIDSLSKLIERIDTLPEFMNWFYTEHAAYSVEGQIRRLSSNNSENPKYLGTY